MEKDRPVISDDDQFTTISNQLPLLISACRADGSYYFFNSAWRDFTGAASKHENHTDSSNYAQPNDSQASLDIPSKDKTEFQRIYRLKRHDGVYRWIAERCVPRFEDGDNFAGYVGYGIDIQGVLDEQQLKGDWLSFVGAQTEGLNEELAATNEELSAANEELASTNEELGQTQESLAELNRHLENIVAERTSALLESQQIARQLNEELATTNEELAAANEELSTTNEELLATNEELAESRDEIIKSEKLFKSIALNIPKSLILVIGKDHRFLAVEGDLMSKMGFDGRDYVGKHPSEVATPERYEANKHLYARVLAGEQFTIDRKGQADEDYRIEFVPLRDDANEVYAGLVIALDITDIKQAEEKSAKLAAIVTSSDDAIVSKTLDGVVTSWNASAERMFGYSEKEMVGQPILKIIPNDRKNEEPNILQQLRKGRRVDHFETKRITKDGKILDVSLTISPVKDSEGHIIGVSKIARDISEQKLDEQRKNDFIGMVSHELKTPLTSLTAIIQLLQAKIGNGEDANITVPLKNANKQVKKMATMINGFLNISRLESGKMLIVKDDFLLNDLLREAVDETQMISADYDFRFNDTQPVSVFADKDKIGSVILNLLSNAVKYSPKSTTIDVDCKVVNGKVRVSVKDEGIGIKSTDVKKLFDRYYRVETDDTRHIAGFGIGLYLSAEIIRQHQGDIWAESEPGKGSTFYFELPLK